MRQGLVFYGCNVSTIATAQRQGHRNRSTVRIYPTHNGMELLRLGMQHLIDEDITLPGKIWILAEYLARFRQSSQLKDKDAAIVVLCESIQPTMPRRFDAQQNPVHGQSPEVSSATSVVAKSDIEE
ncbi:unnamed protein product [Absidia cylindrospora]